MLLGGSPCFTPIKDVMGSEFVELYRITDFTSNGFESWKKFSAYICSN
jgi:hypothetical protein